MFVIKHMHVFFVFLKDTFQLCQLFDQNVQFFCVVLQICYHGDSLIDLLDYDPVVQCLVSHHEVLIACSFRVCFPGRRVKAYE
jgi:hypothetical protein